MRRMLLAAGMVVALAACGGGQKVDGSVSYYHDAERGVSCWVVWGNGISCLPDSEVTP